MPVDKPEVFVESEEAPEAPATMSEALERASRLPEFNADEIDDGFASIQEQLTQNPSVSDTLAGSYGDMQSLFADMVAAQIVPIRELLLEIDAGGMRREWLDMCRPIARELKNAAEQLPDPQLHRALCALCDALEAPGSNGSAQTAEAGRIRIREAYASLTQLLPALNDLEEQRARREPIIIQAIFECTAGLGRLQRDKLAATGFATLSTLCMARAKELSEVSGIPVDLTTRLVAEIERFKHTAARFACAKSPAADRRELIELTAALRRQNEVFEASRRGWSRQDRAAKRSAQRAREETLARLKIVLAQLGELALIAQLEKLPFDRKVLELEGLAASSHNDGLTLSEASGGK